MNLDLDGDLSQLYKKQLKARSAGTRPDGLAHKASRTCLHQWMPSTSTTGKASKMKNRQILVTDL